MAPEEWPSRTIRKNGALQNPAYRLADVLNHEGFGVTRRTPRHLCAVIPGRAKHEPGISRFRVRIFDAPRNDGVNDYATIFVSSAISASGAVTFGEWLASIS